jgi:hypothetical protein
VIDSFAEVDPKLVDVVLDHKSGYPDECAAQDSAESLSDVCGDSLIDFPDAWWVENKDREELARENDKNFTWGINSIDRFTNQQPTDECTCHMLRAEAESARNISRGIIFKDGPKKDFRYEESKRGSVWLSPLSIYAEANPRQYGGASCRQVLEIARRRGFLPEKIQPFDYGFEHTLQGTTGQGNSNQSRGPWVRLRDFPDGWQDTAAWFRPREVIVTTDWEKALCMLIRGRVLGYGRNRHAVPPSFWNVKSNVIGYVDSYNVVRYDSLATFKAACRQGVHCIVSMTTPDDWLKPAG